MSDDCAHAGSHPLLAGADLTAPLVWVDGRPVSRAEFVAQARRLSSRLTGAGPLLALTGSRHRFALTLVAGLLKGRGQLMPPNHTPDLLARLARNHPDLCAVVDGDEVGTVARDAGLTCVPWPDDVLEAPSSAAQDVGREVLPGSDPNRATLSATHTGDGRTDDCGLSLAADQVVASVFTSGSTGDPVPHAKRWGGLVLNIAAEARRVAEHLGRPDLQGVTLVGTVPAQHMYGFESTVLLALLGGAAFAAERPFFPADVVRVLESVPRPRVLVTTPFHLRTLVESGLDLPEVDLTVCATAPLQPQLAQQAETALRGPLMEIYGCTEAGQVATRRTVEGPEWRVFDGLSLSGNGEASVVSGGHVPVPVTLGDVLEVVSPTRFRLLGRTQDLINIAGKRSSLAHLNFHLNAIPGVRDGAFHLPAEEAGRDAARLVAVVVAPGVDKRFILDELRRRVDAVFVPRRIVQVEAIPRDPTGKLPAARLAQLVAQAT